MSTRTILALGLLFAPATCFASDPTGLLFLFTIPVLLISLLTAFAIAFASKTKRGYSGLIVLAVLNFLPGIFLTIELLRHERSLIPGFVHAVAYCLLLVPFKALQKRLKTKGDLKN